MSGGLSGYAWFMHLRLLLALLFGLLTGCGNMAPSQAPAVALEAIHPFGTTRIAFHPSGERLATGGFRGEVKLWRVPEGDALRTLPGDYHPITALAWAGEEKLAVGDERGTLRLHRLRDGERIASVESGAEVRALAHWGGVVVAGLADGALVAYTRSTLKEVARGRAGGAVRSLAIHGERLAVATEGRRVVLYDWGLKPYRELARPPREVQELRFSPDGRRLAAGGWYDWMLWDLQSGALQRHASEHWGAIISLDFTPDGRHLLTLGRHTDANLRLVEVASNRVVRRLKAHRLCGAQVRVSPDGRWAATGSDDESLRLYDLTAPYRPE